MPADLTEQDGQVLMAANVARGNPWHNLGHKLDHDMGMEEALELVRADDHVMPVTLYTANDMLVDSVTLEGSDLEEVEGYVGVKSDRFGTISVVRPSYEITQRRDILALAYDIVGLAPDTFHIDTIGNLGPRADTFFAYIRVPDIVVDPEGVADRVERGLFVATSFDTSLPNVIGYSDVRPVCRNTVSLALKNGLRQTIRVKHTVNSERRMQEAAEALQYSGAVEKAMVERAQEMLKVDGGPALTAILDHFFPLKEDLADVTRARRENSRDSVRYLYEGDGNTSTSLLGPTGWAAYQAWVEYVDYYRPVRNAPNTTERRSRNAVLPGESVNMKVKGSEIVQALAA